MAPEDQQSQLAAAVTEVSNRATLIVREEIELAKAEVTEKVTKLAKAAAVGAAAGIFVVIGLLFLLHSAAWGLYNIYGGQSEWAGYLTVAVILFILAAIGGFLAMKFVKKGSPPTPVMAIDEAKKVKATVDSARSGGAKSDG
ncbi:MAG: phage holin family protein [Solirubrobacteraceae bacterium]